MKFIKSLTLAVCCAAILGSLSIARAEDKKPCCEATVEAGKKCDHECCKKAAEKGKVCKKCHKDEKKEAK